MADTSNDSKLGRYLAVCVAAAGAACAATSLYWNLHFRGTSWLIGSFDLGPSLYGMSSAPSTPAAGKGKKGKKKKKGGSSGNLNGMDTREPSTASTGPSAGGGPAVYETKRAVNEYLQFHFGDPNDVLPYRDGPHDALRFTQRCADLCAKHTKSVKTSRTEPAGLALDIGCAVGGATFELAKHFAIVEGLDSSRAFITAARLMKERGSLRYTCFREGEVTRKLTGAVNDRVDRARVSFREGDACGLPRSLLGGGGSGPDFDAFGRHDAVLAANLLCRLPDPAAFLAQCARLLRPGGALVLVSPPLVARLRRARRPVVDRDGDVAEARRTHSDVLLAHAQMLGGQRQFGAVGKGDGDHVCTRSRSSCGGQGVGRQRAHVQHTQSDLQRPRVLSRPPSPSACPPASARRRPSDTSGRSCTRRSTPSAATARCPSPSRGYTQRPRRRAAHAPCRRRPPARARARSRPAA